MARKRRILVTAFIAALILLAGLIWARSNLEAMIDPEEIIARIEEATGRDVSAESVGVSLLGGITLRGFEMREGPETSSGGSGTAMMADATVNIEISWLGLLFGEARLTGIGIRGGTILLAESVNGTPGPGGTPGQGGPPASNGTPGEEGKPPLNWEVFINEMMARSEGTPAPPIPPIHGRNLSVSSATTDGPIEGLEISGLSLGLESSRNGLNLRGHAGDIDGAPAGIDLHLAVSRAGGETVVISGEISIEALPARALDLIGAAPDLSWGGMTVEADLFISGDSLFVRASADADTFAPRAGVRPIEGISAREVVYTEEGLVRTLSAEGLEWDGNRLDFTARLSSSGEVLLAETEWDGDAGSILRLLPEEWRRLIAAHDPAGESAGRAEWSRGGSFAGTLVGRGCSVKSPFDPEERLSDMRGEVSWGPGGLVLRALSFSTRGGRLSLTGRWSDTSQYEIAVGSEGFDLGELPAEMGVLPEGVGITGPVGLDLDVSPGRASGTVRFMANEISLGERNLTVSGGEVSISPDSMILSHLRVGLAGDEGEASGMILIRPEQMIDISVAAERVEISRIMGLLDETPVPEGIEISGPAGGRIDLAGPIERPEVSGTISLAGAAIGIGGTTFGNLSGDLEFDSKTLRIEGISNPENTFSLSGTASAGEEYDLNLFADGIEAGDLSRILPEGTLPPGLILAGLVSFDGGLNGRLGSGAAPELSGRLGFDDLAVSMDSWPVPVRNLSGGIMIGSNEFTLEDLSGRTGDGTFELSGILPRDDESEFDLSVRGENMDLTPFAPLIMKDLLISGTAASVTGGITGPRAEPEPRLEIELSGVSVLLPSITRPIENLRGNLSLGPGSFSSTGLAFNLGERRVDASGGITDMENLVMSDVRITAEELDAGEIISLLTEDRRPVMEGLGISGTVRDISLLANGPVAAAEWSGRARIEGITASIEGMDIIVEDLSGDLVFDGDRAASENLAGRIGTHPVYLSGGVSLAPPYDVDASVGISMADLGSLFSGLPGHSSPGMESIGLEGTADITSAVTILPGRITLSGEFERGEMEAFGLEFGDALGDFRYETPRLAPGEAVLELDNSRASLWGGIVSGGMRLAAPRETPAAFSLDGTITSADLSRMVDDLYPAREGYEGVVSGSLSVSGVAGERESLDGRASIRVEEGRFPDLEPLSRISRLLSFSFDEARYSEGSATFTIEDGYARTNDLILRGDEAGLTGEGYIHLRGDIVMDITIGLRGGAAGRVMNATGLAGLLGAGGRGSVLRIDGTVRGTVSDPDVDLDLGAASAVGGALGGLFHILPFSTRGG